MWHLQDPSPESLSSLPYRTGGGGREGQVCVNSTTISWSLSNHDKTHDTKSFATFCSFEYENMLQFFFVFAKLNVEKITLVEISRAPKTFKIQENVLCSYKIKMSKLIWQWRISFHHFVFNLIFRKKNNLMHLFFRTELCYTCQWNYM